MLIPTQIIFRNIPSSDAISAEVLKQLDKLQRSRQEILGCHVTIEALDKHQHQGRLYQVRVHLTMANGMAAITCEHADEDAYVAVRGALEVISRELTEKQRRARVRSRRAGARVPANEQSDVAALDMPGG
ncbi:HPF/RaiA family ribosome-associated protein [Pandoraea sp.]|uniref:HPF/RaiA family ribosome-associated protein n=1 Tax=Pandoraea sp. TaxID=1883445 RepID=UPI0011F92F2D|nr:HPF/RaiA family ribosome-associated protein [Pandoraea sp.]TAL55809.1 MAG: ribosome-associated translation inhibitor RaiA [Pandoraea sp.]TAM15693.1 MAG: ribosome-associated translation inhibitor RaiA [Pandoraea sp.]